MRFSHRFLLHALAMALAVGLLCRLLMHDAASGLAAALAQGVGNTLVLALTAALAGLLAGALLGLRAALHRSRWPDRMASALAVMGVSLPHCWLGLVLVAALSASLGWWPVVDAGLLLPALALGVIPAGIAMRTVHVIAIGVHSRGCAPPQRFAWQVLKHSGPAVLAAMAPQLRHLVGGAVLLETIFVRPGMGQLLHTALFQRDAAMLQSTVLVLALMLALMRLLATHPRRPGGTVAKGM